MSIQPPKDIPAARRQPSEISLEEIENLRLVAPRKKSPVLPVAMSVLLLGGLGGLGYWQRDWLRPRFERVKGVIAEASANLLEKDEQPATATASAQEPEASESASASAQSPAEASVESSSQGANNDGAAARPDVSVNPVATEDSAGDSIEDASDELLNHRRYQVRDAADLVPLNPNSTLMLAPDAQAAVTEMLAKAKAEGVQLGLISGFRTLEDQNYLYFDLKAERGQSAQARAEVSAPPGYSEHHTGYAVDFIDESKPRTHLEESFETTAAFRWLEKNAPFFNFEMSFPKGNEANVGYEPWHWRYVGNQESLELFYK